MRGSVSLVFWLTMAPIACAPSLPRVPEHDAPDTSRGYAEMLATFEAKSIPGRPACRGDGTGRICRYVLNLRTGDVVPQFAHFGLTPAVDPPAAFFLPLRSVCRADGNPGLPGSDFLVTVESDQVIMRERHYERRELLVSPTLFSERMDWADVAFSFSDASVVGAVGSRHGGGYELLGIDSVTRKRLYKTSLPKVERCFESARTERRPTGQGSSTAIHRSRPILLGDRGLVEIDLTSGSWRASPYRPQGWLDQVGIDERNTFYVVDAHTLVAFDFTSGKVHWKLTGVTEWLGAGDTVVVGGFDSMGGGASHTATLRIASRSNGLVRLSRVIDQDNDPSDTPRMQIRPLDVDHAEVFISYMVLMR